MKNLYALVISVFTILLIASCDSSTSANTQEGQRIGTFMVYDNQMDWVGVQSQSKSKDFTTQAVGDTAFFDYPDGKNLYMVDKGELFALSYQDSLYNNSSDTIPHVHLSNPLAPGYSEWASYGPRVDHIDYDLAAVIDCDSSYTESENIYASYYTQADTNSTYIQTVVLNTDGIVEAAKSLRCN